MKWLTPPGGAPGIKTIANARQKRAPSLEAVFSSLRPGTPKRSEHRRSKESHARWDIVGCRRVEEEYNNSTGGVVYNERGGGWGVRARMVRSRTFLPGVRKPKRHEAHSAGVVWWKGGA